MPSLTPPVTNEREGLLTFLSQQRHVPRIAAYGLTDEQARSTPSASTLSIGGLIKHVAATERDRVNRIVQRETSDDDDYVANFRLGPDETLGDVLTSYEEVARETELVVAGITDLGQPVPIPQGVPWFPADAEAWSVRWVLLHLIEETARHAGHADIVRESLDGATAFALLSAAEGAPVAPWIEPWRPPAS